MIRAVRGPFYRAHNFHASHDFLVGGIFRRYSTPFAINIHVATNSHLISITPYAARKNFGFFRQTALEIVHNRWIDPLNKQVIKFRVNDSNFNF